ncbi:hypothetical protein A3I27_02670 [Candidatus Giovannonibacteria bacterium RIFCSPLOWO2_02_FULL_43_11b]|uniref:Glycosyltransferase subfamily 4-like N-terminal domain-containing protein n=1 Tax=Candidatus Giovannonibacteria bacterium RIFCSPHIGHO2_12_FULL_43_15 TaxID=1798341 RepID=A0A1F5WQ25_9BACT|nr:MAG: hypothetical protein A2739_03310 [Candidatus Giovannonibacteria bacterium RIFCSPHIGHO2_01_FULL_43_100]OGF66291.1 MAG: hypothetical protein A3B97_01805 [Candidatus Giovannonibacteria bacterium RIFCSPHIGHO2_02_FULL_43_32]OGF77361.1 MAG: hypothetical protein A3F23_00225 [Candidatus Giovannonibacteria bacterium RIFCSPHIGHO2_12_FULL_43_15]OGF79184.1 MAG: hypothetical protein A3A15_00990 [Candidatus Giovannonibacteria bacterium RIFCSPLOWO2_01_FULL_43_60]OGF90542.1 MAG: hypothetical protein A3
MSSNKTILLPVYNGIRAKNFFRNDSYRELVSIPGIRLIILIPSSKLDYYQKEFPEKNVIFEPLDIISESAFGVRLYDFCINLLFTKTTRTKQYRDYLKYRNTSAFAKLMAKRAINFFLGPFGFIMLPIVHFLDNKFVSLDEGVSGLLKKYNPDLVLAPDIVFPPDRVVLRAAKRLGFYTVGMIRSWDNLTSKGVVQVLPRKLIVYTTVMKIEAIKYAGMPEKDIVVTGIPHYDAFYRPLKISREAFLKSLGIPLDRKIILTAPFMYSHTGSAEIIIKELLAAIDSGKLSSSTHLLVRYRPATPEIAESRLPKSDHMTITSPCERCFQVKNLQSPTEDWEWSDKDVELLLNSLAYSDVVINYMSTLSIDAAVFDKPVINIRFEADPTTPPHKHVNAYVGMLHYEAMEDSGGVRRVWNMNELIDATRDYLLHPEKEREGRARMVAEQIEFTDGLAGKRTAEYIRTLLYSRS